MNDAATHLPPETRPPTFRPRGAVFLLLPLLLACGGGGSPGIAVGVRAGFGGAVSLPDVHLGRVPEQEPNDTAAHAFALPPVSARSVLEFTGELGTTAQWFGRIDTVDAYRLELLAAQDVEAAVVFAPLDPVAAGANEIELVIRDPETQLVLASTAGGPQPRTVPFTLAAPGDVIIEVICSAGHTPYTVTVTTADPGGPMPLATPLPATQLPPAEEGQASPPGVLLRGDVSSLCADTHVLTGIRDGVDPRIVAERHGLIVGRTTAVGSTCLCFPAPLGRGSEDEVRNWVERLRADPDVERAEPDWLVQCLGAPAGIPSELSRQWNLRAVGAQPAWEITRGDADIVVGIIDTGIIDHPDLEGQVLPGYDFVSDAQRAGDGDGRDADPTDPGDEERSAGRSSWHGSHIGAIACARGDETAGLSGVAPGCRILPLRAVGIGGGLLSDVSDAILVGAGLTEVGGFSIPGGLAVLNMSFGLPLDAFEIRTACQQAADAGVILVGAVGNDASTTVLYPAAYASVIGVTAVDGAYDAPGYANSGTAVSLAAPGGRLLSDTYGDGWPDGVLSVTRDDTLEALPFASDYLTGTSQASPHVAAAVALLLSIDPTLDRSAVEGYLQDGALDRGAPGNDIIYGSGVLQVHEALKALRADQGTPIVAPPSLFLPTTSLVFSAAKSEREAPVLNGGGGVLSVLNLAVATDDGAPWLDATPLSPVPGPVATPYVHVAVDRSQVPAAPGIYSGTVFLRNGVTVLGTLRVVMYVQMRPTAGVVFRVIARLADNQGARAFDVASPAVGYRYAFPRLGAGAFLAQAGDDMDQDGFICEAVGACGWYGGPSPGDALVILTNPTSMLFGRDIVLIE